MDRLNYCAGDVLRFIFCFFLFINGCQITDKNKSDPYHNVTLDYGKQRLYSAIRQHLKGNDSEILNKTVVKIQSKESDLPEKAFQAEGYRIYVNSDSISITGYDEAGALYGSLELAKIINEKGEIPGQYEVADAPVMKLRGTCILLMKLGTYNYPITPETFPFFYDKNLWIDYLDFLADNRYNYIAFWNGHPFDYFVKLEKYPESQSGMGEELIEKNKKMLSWLCEEGLKRNIRFLFQFYNIHTSVYFQEAHNLPDEISEPTPLLADYTAYSIEAFLNAFPQVGLYVTPGEAIDLQYTDAWINDVIFPAIHRSGKMPPVFVRSWFFDLDHAGKILGHYPNLYFERKFNVEMIADTIPDPENRLWADLNGNLIVNIHMAANLEPFRWNPPSYIQKCMKNAHRDGSNGLHLYPRKSWRWPYGSDMEAAQLQWDRDALWFEAWGRYAWNPYRDEELEIKYWLERLAVEFGNDAALYFLNSFESGADVLPALQRLIWLGHDNHTVLSAGAKLSQLERAKGAPFLDIKNTLRIPEYLKFLRKNKIPNDNPINFLEEVRQMAQNSLKEAEKAVKLASWNQSKASGYQNDARMTALIADFYYHKIKAISHKTLYENNLDAHKNKKNFLYHLKLSVEVFEELTSLGSLHYESLSDVPAKHPEKLEKCPYHWRDILPIYQKEYEIYESESKTVPDEAFFKPTISGLAGIWYSDPDLKNPDHTYITAEINFDWSGKSGELGRNWSARWFGYIVPSKTETIVLQCQSDRGVIIKSGEEVLLDWSGKEDKKEIHLKINKDIPLPIEVIYNHEGGDKGFLRIKWYKNNGPDTEYTEIRYFHSQAQKQQMDRISILN
jgi:hypothetical protein